MCVGPTSTIWFQLPSFSFLVQSVISGIFDHQIGFASSRTYRSTTWSFVVEVIDGIRYSKQCWYSFYALALRPPSSFHSIPMFYKSLPLIDPDALEQKWQLLGRYKFKFTIACFIVESKGLSLGERISGSHLPWLMKIVYRSHHSVHCWSDQDLTSIAIHLAACRQIPSWSFAASMCGDFLFNRWQVSLCTLIS